MHNACYQRILQLASALAVAQALALAGATALVGCAGSPRAPEVPIVPEAEEAILYRCAVSMAESYGYTLDGADEELRHFRTGWVDDPEGGRVRVRGLVYTSEMRGPGLDLSRERQVMRDGVWDVAANDAGADAQIAELLEGVRQCWAAESAHGGGR